APYLDGMQADGFDEEAWQWLASYSSWSTVMYVLLYPECAVASNLPRAGASPGFDKIVAPILGGANQETVNQAIADYDAYLEAIDDLVLLGVHAVGNRLFLFARPVS